MIEIIPANKFKQIPWKNGQGTTTELAISTGGTVDDFDWRLSIASVVEDGSFSDFSGYLRQLILIDGNGIELKHNNDSPHKLTKLLDMGVFDGGSQTIGTLYDGAIKDFNVMTKCGKYTAKIETMVETQSVVLKKCLLCFIYCLNSDAAMICQDGLDDVVLPKGSLIKLKNNTESLVVKGKSIIIIYIRPNLNIEKTALTQSI